MGYLTGLLLLAIGLYLASKRNPQSKTLGALTILASIACLIVTALVMAKA